MFKTTIWDFPVPIKLELWSRYRYKLRKDRFASTCIYLQQKTTIRGNIKVRDLRQHQRNNIINKVDSEATNYGDRIYMRKNMVSTKKVVIFKKNEKANQQPLSS